MANNMAEPVMTPTMGNLLKMGGGLDSIVANVGPGGGCSNNNSVDDWPGGGGGPREVAAISVPTLRETAATTVPTVREAAAITVPTLREVAAITVPTVRETAATTVPTVRETAATTVPSVRETAAMSVPTVRETAAITVPTLRETAAITVPAVREATAITIPSVREATAITVPTVRETAAISVPTSSKMAAITVPTVRETAAITVPSVREIAAISVPTVRETVAITVPTVREAVAIILPISREAAAITIPAAKETAVITVPTAKETVVITVPTAKEAPPITVPITKEATVVTVPTTKEVTAMTVPTAKETVVITVPSAKEAPPMTVPITKQTVVITVPTAKEAAAITVPITKEVAVVTVPTAKEVTAIAIPTAKEVAGIAVPVANNIEKLPVPLSNVPASVTQLNKTEIRHLPIPQAPTAVNKRHVPVPQLPQAPIQVNKRPPSLPVKATYLTQVMPAQQGGTTANKRQPQVQHSPQTPTPVSRASVYTNRPSTTVSSVQTSAKKSWASASSTLESRQWPVQYHQVPTPAGKRHLPVQEAPKGPTNHAYKRERENRSNMPFGLKEPPPMHSTANKLKTNRNMDRAGIEEALLGQERRPMLKNKHTNPYQFVLQDHNYGAPPPPSPSRSPVNVGPPVSDPERTPWAPGSMYRQQRLDDDAASAISSERGREVEPEGEETETAPEGEGDEDAVTRCICDFQHDDGYMVRCDKCFVWQHLDCMGLDRNNPPKPDDEYLCERCQPRPVERHKARTLQMRKREEIANDSSSDSSSSAFTDNDNISRHPNRPNMPGAVPKKRAQPLAGGRRKSEPTNPRKVNITSAAKQQQQQQQQQQQHRQRQQAAQAANSSKEQHAVQRRASTPGGRKNNPPAREKRTAVRRKTKAPSRGSDDETSQEDWNNRPVDKLRTWIDNYEEAVTNHYSPELRAKVSSIKVNGVHSSALGLHNVPNLVGKCTVRMIEPGIKVLQSSTNIPSNQPVIELRGKHMLATQHKPSPTLPTANVGGRRQRPYAPFVFFYRLPKDDTEVCVDSRTYGNDARFVRRSCRPNSEVWHCMEKGMLHLYIVSTCVIDKNTEITIGHDKLSDPPAHCVCGNPKECGVRPRNNGPQAPTPLEPKPSEEAKDRRKRRGRRTRSTSVSDRGAARPTREKPKERPPPRTPAPPPPPPPAPVAAPPPPGKPRRSLGRERRTPAPTPAPKAAKVVKEKPVTPPPPPPPPRALTPRPVTPVEVVAPPTRRSSNPRTPVKLDPTPDVEDRKGTEDSEEKKAEDSKIKTREERKIEAIMKAFERMERESKRKVDNQSKQAKRKDTPRKDSAEIKREQEPVLQPPPAPVFNERPKKRRRKGRGRANSSAATPTAAAPKRRRTRFNSGRSDSDSADGENNNKMGPPFTSPSVSSAAGLLMALSQPNNGHCYPADKLQTPSPPPSGGAPSQFDSGCSSSSSHSSVTPTLSSACLLVAAAVGPLAPGFKFPKTKKGLMNEWLNKSPDFPPTPSPTLSHPYPPIGSDEGFPFNKSLDTLAQAAIATSPNKENHGSAKKRWLRQVMSQEGDGSGSPNSRAGSPPCSDYVTPLKKRRVARESQSSEHSFTPPTTPTEQDEGEGGTCEIVSVGNTPSLSRADSPQQLVESESMSAQMQRDIREQLEGSAPEQLEGSAPEQLEGSAPEQLEGSAPEQLEGSAPEQPEGEEEEESAKQPEDVIASVSCKVSTSAALELDSKMETMFETERDLECAKKESDALKVEQAKEEAKIAKRKLSISEYRQRKQLDTPTGPSEPTSLNVSPAPRLRSNSSSSSTGSSSSLSDDETTPGKQMTLPDLPAFLPPPYADPGDDKKGLGEERGNKFDHAPTLVERQRENLMQRLRREFGLFLGDESDANKQPGLVSDPLVDIDEKRRGLLPPPPSPLDSALPPRGTFPFQSKPPATYNSTAPYALNNNVNYISTITGNRPNSTTYPGSVRCPPALPGRYSNYNAPYSMTGNFHSAPPPTVLPREVQAGGGAQNTQTSAFALARGNKPFHTVAAAKAYFPHNNLHDRE